MKSKLSTTNTFLKRVEASGNVSLTLNILKQTISIFVANKILLFVYHIVFIIVLLTVSGKLYIVSQIFHEVRSVVIISHSPEDIAK